MKNKSVEVEPTLNRERINEIFMNQQIADGMADRTSDGGKRPKNTRPPLVHPDDEWAERPYRVR